jgi:pilus assembly protein CpaB
MKRQLILAAVCGVFAALFAALYLNSVEQNYRRGAEKVKVLCASQYVDQGTMLDETVVEEKLVPKDYLQPKAVQTLKELRDKEGNKLFLAIVPIEKGEQVTTTKLSLLGLDTGVSALIPSEKRAMTIPVENPDFARMVKPGNRVDIIGIFQFQAKDGRLEDGAFTVLQDVLVLSVGKEVLGAPKARPGKQGDNPVPASAEQAAAALTVSLSPREAELLSLTMEKAAVRFSLRPMGDDRIVETSGTRLQDIYKDMSISAKPTTAGAAASNEAYARDVEAKQKELMKILQKYKR